MARELVIRIFGAEEARERLFQGANRAGSMEPAFEDIAEDMRRITAINFSSEGRRGGGSWAWLSPSRLRQKIKAGLPEDILIAHKRLYESVTTDNDDSIADIYKNRINFGSALDYAASHQFGNEHLPARPFLRFIESDLEGWVTMCENSIYQAMGF